MPKQLQAILAIAFVLNAPVYLTAASAEDKVLVDLDDGYVTRVEKDAGGYTIRQVKNSGKPENVEVVTRVTTDGTTKTHVIARFGRFSGAIPTETTESVKRFLSTL